MFLNNESELLGRVLSHSHTLRRVAFLLRMLKLGLNGIKSSEKGCCSLFDADDKQEKVANELLARPASNELENNFRAIPMEVEPQIDVHSNDSERNAVKAVGTNLQPQ